MSQLFLFVVSERAEALFSSSELAQMDQNSRTDKIHGMELPRIMGPQFLTTVRYFRCIELVIIERYDGAWIRNGSGGGTLT
jgi:hypothetical protein